MVKEMSLIPWESGSPCHSFYSPISNLVSFLKSRYCSEPYIYALRVNSNSIRIPILIAKLRQSLLAACCLVPAVEREDQGNSLARIIARRDVNDV